jgi:hypothetical protein
MNKKGISGYVYIMLVIALIVAMGILFQTTILPPNNDNPGDGWQTKESKEIKESKKDSNGVYSQESSGSELSIESSSGGSGGSSSGGGGSEEQAQSGQTCYTRQLTYTIKNNFKNETCNFYDNQSNCIDKTVFCSAEIENIDSVPGDFTVRLVFVEDRKDKETEYFGEVIESFNLNPLQTYTMSSQENIQSIGQEGLANKIINCFFNTVGDVQAQICS